MNAMRGLYLTKYKVTGKWQLQLLGVAYKYHRMFDEFSNGYFDELTPFVKGNSKDGQWLCIEFQNENECTILEICLMFANLIQMELKLSEDE